VAKMKAVQVPKAGADFEIVERKFLSPAWAVGIVSKPASLSRRCHYQRGILPASRISRSRREVLA
jgi:hypothetical protein